MHYRFAFVAALMIAVSPAAFAADAQKTPETKTELKTSPKGEFTPVLPATAASSMQMLRDSGGMSTSALILDAPISGDYVLGDAKAPIVMVEYASMSCPHCAHFSNTVLPEIEKKYIETGKLRYILRQFPLNESALKAAMLLVCIGDQNSNKYYTFSKVLFDAQNKWAFEANYLSNLETIAAVGGISKDQFNNCVNNTDREMRVLKIKQKATEDLKLPHTPYIFIGGEVFAGDRSIEAVSQFIDAKLARVKK